MNCVRLVAEIRTRNRTLLSFDARQNVCIVNDKKENISRNGEKQNCGGKILPNYYSFMQKTKFQVTPFTIFQKLLPKSNQPPILPTQNIYNL